MDFAGSLPEAKSEAGYIIVAVEHLTLWVTTKAIGTQTAEAAISFFQEEIVAQFGSPENICTEQGSAFLSAA